MYAELLRYPATHVFRRLESGAFALVDGVAFHLYISQTPCTRLCAAVVLGGALTVCVQAAMRPFTSYLLSAQRSA